MKGKGKKKETFYKCSLYSKDIKFDSNKNVASKLTQCSVAILVDFKMYDHYKDTKCKLSAGTDNFRSLTTYKKCWDESEKDISLPVKK